MLIKRDKIINHEEKGKYGGLNGNLMRPDRRVSSLAADTEDVKGLNPLITE